MTTEIKAPTFPESVQDGVVATWHKKAGDTVARDELVVEIETDKVVLEVVAPADGVVSEIVKAEGDTVLSNEVIAVIGESGSKPAADNAKEKTKSNKKSEAAAKAGSTDNSSGELVDIKAPTFPESVQDGLIATWHKKEGEAVARDELIVEIETDKVVLEVVAPADGALSSIIKNEGDTIQSNEVIAKISAGASGSSQEPSQASAPADNADSGEAIASPSARKLAEENGINLAKVKGTEKGGRISKEDVQKAIDNKPASKPSAPKAAAPAEQAVPAGARVEKRVPMTRLRKRIAERLLDATSSTAMLTTFNEVNMAPVMALRSKYKDQFEKAHNGTRLGFMGFFVKAAVEALKRFPAVNASIDNDDIVYHGFQDIGVAVSTEKGLVVPVLRNTENMGLADIESTIRDYGLRGRDGKLSIEEMTGGTFTITNGGVFGSLLSTPILNPPQTAILGMHKIQERPMAVNGEVKILPMMYLALSYDHRLVDGKEAVQFLVAIKDLLEDPARILLEI